jgi:hypothetical protein
MDVGEKGNLGSWEKARTVGPMAGGRAGPDDRHTVGNPGGWTCGRGGDVVPGSCEGILNTWVPGAAGRGGGEYKDHTEESVRRSYSGRGRRGVVCNRARRRLSVSQHNTTRRKPVTGKMAEGNGRWDGQLVGALRGKDGFPCGAPGTFAAGWGGGAKPGDYTFGVAGRKRGDIERTGRRRVWDRGQG